MSGATLDTELQMSPTHTHKDAAFEGVCERSTLTYLLRYSKSDIAHVLATVIGFAISICSLQLSVNCVLLDFLIAHFYSSITCFFLLEVKRSLKMCVIYEWKRKEIFTRQVKTTRGGSENWVWVLSLPLKKRVRVWTSFCTCPECAQWHAHRKYTVQSRRTVQSTDTGTSRAVTAAPSKRRCVQWSRVVVGVWKWAKQIKSCPHVTFKVSVTE